MSNFDIERALKDEAYHLNLSIEDQAHLRNITRAWKDESYRSSLSSEDLKKLPAHPAGNIEVPEDKLEAVAGGLDESGPSARLTCPLPSYCGQCIPPRTLNITP